MPLGRVADTSNRGEQLPAVVRPAPRRHHARGARRRLAELATQMTRDHPEDDYTFTARELHEVVTEGASRGLWVLLGATALLLLIACTNVANLLLARRWCASATSRCGRRSAQVARQLFGQVMGETVALGAARQRGRSGPGVGAAAPVRRDGAGRTFRGSRPSPRSAVLPSPPASPLVAGLVAGLAPAMHLSASRTSTPWCGPVPAAAPPPGAPGRRAGCWSSAKWHWRWP